MNAAKKILLFGQQGQVAWELQRELSAHHMPVVSFSSQEVSFLNPSLLSRTIQEQKPQIIINAAAYTAVDKAESEIESAMQINGHAVGVIAEEAKKCGASLLHYSTDYVFSGDKKTAYVETDPTGPLGVYGQSKLLGEKWIQQSGCAHVILRTSWVYGSRGNNFYRTMLRLGQEKEELRVVNDQWGAPTWSGLIAQVSRQILQTPDWTSRSGIYHLASQGETNWHQFAELIFSSARARWPERSWAIKNLLAISSSQYPTAARRPVNSRLNTDKLCGTFGLQLPDWRESLALVLRETSLA